MSARKKGYGVTDDDEPVGFAEMTNPGITADIERRGRPKHPFDGDEHGHERHDTIPAEEEWDDDELDPGAEHNPHEAG